MAEFIVEGGYDVPLVTLKSGGLSVNDEDVPLLQKKNPNFRKCGCYVFSRKSGRGSTPIYIGKTEKQPLIKRAFDDGTIRKVMRWLNDQPHRKLQIWIITQTGPGQPHVKAIDEIETALIRWAIVENPELLNKQKTKAQNWWIKGVDQSGRGKRSKVSAEFRKLVGID